MVTVAAFYRFAPLPDPGALRGPLARLACGLGVKGSVLLAPEGVNGTIAGSAEAVGAVLDRLRAEQGFGGLEAKLSGAEVMPFGKLKVRLKREIVTMGRPLSSSDAVGDYVAPSDWNAVLRDPGTVVVDVRNAYEVAIGSFEGALDPGTETFGEFPEWWAANRERLAGKRVAMFCTGGIRCEKSTALLRAEGVEDVVHLRGGILKYLEEVPEEESLWHGGCFVFDDRVSVGHGLVPGGHVLCHACRRPVPPEAMESPDWEAGVSCPLCIGEFDRSDRARFRERMRQIGLARARGTRHLGS
ncbi:oxygen-dependent tRNA uridine(34) hydroxylase TrhO [Jannaschia formosa]|uniref:oxygen-dependent tRNA uridine(34) hydroxylase TrhO n=1 Tax=Jannaschia formosa TaxID=2259592 RepID=UPI000E1C3095|nr:rhodanese-related sulfurtransferase [Jannaschia formosa]TFL18831.1 rhodanese-related sulfurtransferase [Jannaschia formosa]